MVFKALGGFSVENEVFNFSKNISCALSGTFYGIEKYFHVTYFVLPLQFTYFVFEW